MREICLLYLLCLLPTPLQSLHDALTHSGPARPEPQTICNKESVGPPQFTGCSTLWAFENRSHLYSQQQAAALPDSFRLTVSRTESFLEYFKPQCASATSWNQ
jgi:hypothetical protein